MEAIAQVAEQVQSTEPNMTVEGNTNPDNQIEQPDTTYVNGKYKDASELEKGYQNLSSKLGSFTGAPEQYELPESLGIGTGDPLFDKLSEVARSGNMNNEMFSSLVTSFVETQEAQEAEYSAEQIKLLGENGNERLQNIKDWSNANLGEHAEALQEHLTNAKGVEAIEALIAKTKAPSPANAPTTSAIDKDKLLDMRMAKDSNGNRRMEMDFEYAQRVRDAEASYYERGGK